jgi:hypothetical protein
LSDDGVNGKNERLDTVGGNGEGLDQGGVATRGRGWGLKILFLASITP